MNISFDFDNTLSKPDVQDFVRYCMDKRFTIWVITARSGSLYDTHNRDLYNVVTELNIEPTKVIFMNHVDKYNFLLNKDFIFHLDDDFIEVELINENTQTLGVYKHPSVDWEEICWGRIKELI